jgi:MFS family permease
MDVAAAPASQRARSRAGTALRALEVRDFRLLWFNSLTFFVGRSMGMVAVSWLVKELTDSSFMVGLSFFAQGMPVALLILPAGAWADRIDRRSLLIASQVMTAALIAVLTLLILAEIEAIWSVLLLGVGLGASQAIGLPSRQAIVPSLVGQERLMNAIVLTNMVQNLSFVIGPALAGIALAVLGFKGTFVIQVALLAAGIPWLVAMRRSPVPEEAAGERSGMISQVWDGVRYIARSDAIRPLFVISAFSGVFFLGSFQALMPIFADDVLDVGDLGLGIMNSVFGIGTFAGSLYIATRGDLPRKGQTLLVSLLLGAVVFFAFALSESFAFSLAMLLAWGAGAAFFMNLTTTLIQSRVLDNVMGRVMSVQTLAFFGLSPIGALIGGAIAQAYGAPAAAVVGAIAIGSVSAWYLLRNNGLRTAS